MSVILFPFFLSSSSPFHCCVLCCSIVGLGLCLCGRVVSLWNSGDGLYGAEGRVVSTVYCSLLTLYVLWCVFQCGVCVVLLCCVVGCGMAVVCVVLSFVFLFLFVLVLGVVRAQLCEHARYPRTPLRLPCCVLPSLLPAFLCAPPFLSLWNGGGGSPCVGVPSWHDGYG